MGREVKNPKAPEPVLKPLRILIAEDSQNDADLVLHNLRKGGFDPHWKRVETAGDFEAALDSGTWDIVISDFKMPSFTGLDALSILRKKKLDVPFIIASGTIGEEVAVSIMKAGANDYLMKDNLVRLATAVERELRDAETRRAKRRADEELRISNERLSLAQKAARSGLWNWDMVTGKIYWSREFYMLFELPDDAEATLDTWEKVMHPDDKKMAMDNLERSIKEGILLENEYRIFVPGGRIKWIGATGSVSYGKDGKPLSMSGICVDINERKRVEKRILEEEKRFSTFFNASPVGIGITRISDTKFIDVNDAFLRLYGYERDEVIGHTSVELELWPVPEERKKMLVSLEKEGKVRNYEAKFKKKSGDEGIALINAELIDMGGETFLLGNLTDITDRKKLEENLKFSEGLLRETGAIAHVGGWEFDPATGKGIWTEEVARIHDMDPGDETNAQIGIEVYKGEHREKIEKAIKEALEFKKPYDLELEMVTRKGNRKWIRTIGHPVVEKGKLVKIRGSFQDITEFKKMEERLRQSEKMEAIGQLAGGIAHDFNNQLAGIMGYSEMLVERLDNKVLREYAEDILRASKRAADLTKNLLAFSRKGKYLAIPVNVHKVIEETISILSHSIDKKIELKRSLMANPAMVKGDPTQIQNILLNLALNARDSIKGAGTIMFSTENVEKEQVYDKEDVNKLENGRYMKISVSDNGCGMSKEVISHIFEPFFTTKDPGKGTGMGLASVYGSVKTHNGNIKVESEPGKGSVFSIYFPLLEDYTEEEVANAEKEEMSGNIRILLVDDEKMVGDMVASMLRSVGHRIIVSNDSEEAVNIYRKSYKDIDLVIMDMIMPKMSGKEVFASIKEINPDVKVILSSGYSIDGDAQSILDAGAKVFIQKPFNMKDLVKTVTEVYKGR